jgi:hypothetical protein
MWPLPSDPLGSSPASARKPSTRQFTPRRVRDEMTESPKTLALRYYFVDEAGDPMLFNRKKQSIVGKEGSSAYFILGKVDLADPDLVTRDLNELRHKLLADPYFKNVPSMQLSGRKTAICFHAKDDLPEVRREVFRLLAGVQFRFYAVNRDKQVIVKKVLEHNLVKPTYRYHPNQLYDRCISHLFKERLHKHDGYKIYFARRGSADRTAALSKALEAARAAFYNKWGIVGTAPIEIIAANARDVAGLQVADYCLWALQRLYERGEDRFVSLIASKLGLIHDVDDVRKSGAGEYYTKSNLPSAEGRAKK